MEYKLAQGIVKEGKHFSYLLIDEKTVAYQISYEIEKLLREKYLNKNIIMNLNVKELRD